MQAVTDAVAEVPGIERLEANLLTGSVLIHYEVSAFVRFIGVLTEALEPMLTLAPAPATDAAVSSPAQITKGIADSFRYLDGQVKVASSNTIDLRGLVPITAATVSLIMAAESMATPLWVTLAIFSVNSFLQLNQI